MNLYRIRYESWFCLEGMLGFLPFRVLTENLMCSGWSLRALKWGGAPFKPFSTPLFLDNDPEAFFLVGGSSVMDSILFFMLLNFLLNSLFFPNWFFFLFSKVLKNLLFSRLGALLSLLDLRKSSFLSRYLEHFVRLLTCWLFLNFVLLIFCCFLGFDFTSAVGPAHETFTLQQLISDFLRNGLEIRLVVASSLLEEVKLSTGWV